MSANPAENKWPHNVFLISVSRVNLRLVLKLNLESVGV